VESALIQHKAVLECAITAAPDEIRGQVVKATVVLTKGYTPSEALVKELQEHVKNITAPYKYPRIIEFVDELPKTISGKIQRNIIKKKTYEEKGINLNHKE
jgi:acetyl-CoA synthetase